MSPDRRRKDDESLDSQIENENALQRLTVAVEKQAVHMEYLRKAVEGIKEELSSRYATTEELKTLGAQLAPTKMWVERGIMVVLTAIIMIVMNFFFTRTPQPEPPSATRGGHDTTTHSLRYQK